MLGNTFYGYDLIALNEVTMLLRLGLATVCGGLLGFERTKKRRAAGIRTYILVCQGACAAMMTGQFVYLYVGSTDVSRIGAQVVSGIGFLGAGTILMTGYHKIRGLTTAAGLWATACMGLALGAGFYLGALTVCLMMYATMGLMDKVQTDYVSRSHYMDLYIVFRSFQDVVNFFSFARKADFKIRDFETTRLSDCNELGTVFSLTFNKKYTHEEAYACLAKAEGVLLIEEV